jgi:hypothetical protein
MAERRHLIFRVPHLLILTAVFTRKVREEFERGAGQSFNVGRYFTRRDVGSSIGRDDADKREGYDVE